MAEQRGQVTINRPNDDQVEVLVDGKVVASANHDDHGWSGMDAVVATACAVARALGGDVDGDPDDDCCGACDCVDQAPRDPADPGAYPGPDPDCECLCHDGDLEDAAVAEENQAEDRRTGGWYDEATGLISGGLVTN